MGCQEIQSWTFNGLVGAFLDLAIAFLLLCASSLTYLASKFLGLFGSSLPCPCNGLFGVPNGEKCWQRALVNCPSEKISSVQFSVKSKFPFGSTWDQNLSPQSIIGQMNKKNIENGCVELDDQVSYSSFCERRSEMSGDVREEKFDIKWKKASNQKGRYALRRRRKVSTDNGRFSSISSYNSFQLDAQSFTSSPASVSKMVNDNNEGSVSKVVNDNNEGSFGPESSGGDALHYGRYSSMDMDLLGRESYGIESNEAIDENQSTDKDASNAFKSDAQGELLCGNDNKHAIRVLEQALEEEHTARVALCLELEKERSAAASAADEAMAMILRLQEEKASIEMEARQYQRMIEEKAAYDFEEMSILKEILIRREREKHFLEKEVETYRQMIFGSEQLDADAQEIGTSHSKRASLLLYSGEDPVLMLQRISKSICEPEKVENTGNISEDGAGSIELKDCTLSFGKELSVPEFDKIGDLKEESVLRDPTINKCDQHLSSDNGGINEEFEEKKLLSLESQFLLDKEVKNLEMHSELKFPTAEGYNLHEKTVASVEEEQQKSGVTGTSQGFASNPIETCNETNATFPYDCDNSEKDDKDENNMFNMGPCTRDVHVIDGDVNMYGSSDENDSKKLLESVALDIPRTRDCPVISRPPIEHDISRSCSDITGGLPPLGCSQRKPLLSNIRRSSMSAVDYERFKIDNEIGWLRERLRIIQEGREKLNSSMEHREKEKVQLQLLGNIVDQIQEIRQLTETRRAVRQSSLPPSHKIMSKKRRWRSVSLEVHREA